MSRNLFSEVILSLKNVSTATNIKKNMVRNKHLPGKINGNVPANVPDFQRFNDLRFKRSNYNSIHFYFR